MFEDKILWLMFGGLVFMAVVLFLSAWFLPTNKELFTTYASVLTGFSGALFMYLKQMDKK